MTAARRDTRGKVAINCRTGPKRGSREVLPRNKQVRAPNALAVRWSSWDAYATVGGVVVAAAGDDGAHMKSVNACSAGRYRYLQGTAADDEHRGHAAEC